MKQKLILLPAAEAATRRRKVADLMEKAGIDLIIVSGNTNIYYLTGRVFAGYIVMDAAGLAAYFVRRPVGLEGDAVEYIRKPEQIPQLLEGRISRPATLGLETLMAPYATVSRLMALYPEARLADASAVLLAARSVKTPYEMEMIALSGARHDRVYRQIPGLFREGMTDVELQVEVEHAMRIGGCLGQLRVSGESMEIHMGNLLAGDNADVPSPYDFTMGGAGVDPSLPVGAAGGVIERGTTVMADMNGNFDGYMTDMSRVFAFGDIPDIAIRAHRCSIDICHRLAEIGVAGFAVKDLYAEAERMVAAEGLEAYFMGHLQHAPFIGHGVGIEINELPVVTARSKDVLAEGNVIALEPKFVIPRVGAVGIENTYAVTASGMKTFNHAPEELIYF